jgi:UDP-GlcNAc:undecaprenyl-phosphate GlcNAc-1-phosphate transferase
VLYGTAAASAALLLTTVLTTVLRPVALRRRRRAAAPATRGGAYATRGGTAHGGTAVTRGAPRVGGPALVAATGVLAAVGVLTGAAPLGSAAGTLLVCAVAVGLVGLVDGVRAKGLDARLRVGAEAAAATAVVHAAGIGWAAGALAVLWIVFVTHAFRMLDSSPGVLGTVGLVTALALCVCAGAEGMSGLAVLLGLFAAALVGFLMHNWHPARARAGSCGSLFTGFLVAGAGLLVNAEHTAPEPAASLSALTAVACADAVLVLVSRHRGRRPDHLAHRLRGLGLTASGAAVVLGAATLLSAGTGVLLHRGALGPAAVWWVVAAAAGSVGLLLRVPVRRIAEPGTQSQSQSQTITGHYH